jgi:uncharacterized membrane protein YkvA (DUF1232 family)
METAEVISSGWHSASRAEDGVERPRAQTKQDAVAVSLAVRDPRVPWYARAVGACVVAHALSPIDLIPDFIPVLGYLDDLVLVPLGLLLMLRLIPADILAEHRAARRRGSRNGR